MVHLRHRLQVIDDPVENDESKVLVSIFTTAELQDEAALVIRLKETFRPTQLDVVVVLTRAHAEFHFLHAGRALRLLLFQLGLLVLELPVIDDLADRRIDLPGDLDQIESERLSFCKCVTRAHHAKLFAGGEYDADFRCTDSVVDPRHVAETAPVWVSLWLSDGVVLQWVDATHRGTNDQSRRTKTMRRGMQNDGPDAGS